MMRLAEVYLNYVDACLEYVGTEVDIHGTEIKLWQTTDATALELFNAIRQRAKMPTKSKVTYEDLRHEYRVELAFEGLYWYFLLRRGYYEQTEVVNYVNNQYRNARYYDSSTHEYKLSDSYSLPGPSVSVATARNLVLPIPDTDATKNPLLKSDANGVVPTEAYTFGEREVSDADLF